MVITLIIKQSVLDKNGENIEDEIMVEKEIIIDSLDDNLVRHIKKIMPKDSLISFGKYYTNYGLMAYDQCFPYIRKNGKIEWKVPYDDVSINEFIETNDLSIEDPILVVVEPNIGGADTDYAELIDWVRIATPILLNRMGNAADVITLSQFVLKLKKHFANKKGEIPETDDVRDAIYKKEVRTINDLKNWLGVFDEGFIRTLLIVLGYKHIGKKYYFSKRRVEKLMNNEDKYAMRVWGKYGHENYFDELCHSIHDFNISLTILMCESDNNNSECFAIMMKRLERLIDEYRLFLKKGKNLKFLKPQRNNKLFFEEIIDELKNKIAEYSNCIDDMCCYLSEKDNYKSDI